MRKVYIYWIGLLFFFLTSTTFAAPGNPLSNSTNNFLGAIVHGQVTHDISANTAGTVAVDAGSRDFRASGTVGAQLGPKNRLKATGEYLQQNIDFTFFTGATRQWVQQGALGLSFQHAFYNAGDYFTLDGYFSHAGSHNLSSITQLFPSTYGYTTAIDQRRIAGSNAGGVNPGVTFHLWQGSTFDVILNYDYVSYANTLGSKIKAAGFGSTGNFTQAFQIDNADFQIKATAAARAPFNDYQLEGDWVYPSPTTALLIGVFGEHVQGKQSLPDTSIVGLNLNYQMDAPPARVPSPRAQSFTSWMAKPAVRMPTVLAISDENIVTLVPGPPPTSTCLAPTTIGSIGSISGTAFHSFSFATAPFFNGNNQSLTFSQTGLPTGFSLDPITGIISSASFPGIPATAFTITATSACGSVTQTGTISSG